MVSLQHTSFLVILALLAISATAKSTGGPTAEISNDGVEAQVTGSKTTEAVASAADVTTAVAAEIQPEEEEGVYDAAAAADSDAPVQYPFRDLPADVLRDFPGLCFGSTALRLFQVGQSWSLSPFCGVASCLVSQDGYHLVERVQDCGPQPKRNARCRNVNARSDAAFPNCCPRFQCEEGVELEYPTQEELQQLAHEAAQAAVRAQYEESEAIEEGVQTGRIAAAADEPAVELAVVPADADDTAAVAAETPIAAA